MPLPYPYPLPRGVDVPALASLYLSAAVDPRDAARDPATASALAWVDRLPTVDRDAFSGAFGVGGWIAVDVDPTPDAWSQVRDAARAARAGVAPFPVWSGGPVGLADRARNATFRAWHDACHVLYAWPSHDVAGELHTARAGARRAFGVARAAGASVDDATGLAVLVYAEVAGQTATYATGGAFPTVDGPAGPVQPVPLVSHAPLRAFVLSTVLS